MQARAQALAFASDCFYRFDCRKRLSASAGFACLRLAHYNQASDGLIV